MRPVCFRIAAIDKAALASYNGSYGPRNFGPGTPFACCWPTARHWTFRHGTRFDACTSKTFIPKWSDTLWQPILLRPTGAVRHGNCVSDATRLSERTVWPWGFSLALHTVVLTVLWLYLTIFGGSAMRTEAPTLYGTNSPAITAVAAIPGSEEFQSSFSVSATPIIELIPVVTAPQSVSPEDARVEELQSWRESSPLPTAWVTRRRCIGRGWCG